MYYSHKNKRGFFAGVPVTLVKSVIIVGAAALLCSGASLPSKNEAAGPEFVASAKAAAANNAATVAEADADFDMPASKADNVESFINPTEGVLTSPFGNRWGRSHNGIDIGANAGKEIFAANSGTVTFAGEESGYGNYIIIDHGKGIETAYAHCSSLVAKAGDTVKKGELIAYVGSTGNSTGPHLHFEVKVGGEFKNPLDYVLY